MKARTTILPVLLAAGLSLGLSQTARAGDDHFSIYYENSGPSGTYGIGYGHGLDHVFGLVVFAKNIDPQL